MTPEAMPLWAEITIAALVLVGAGIALVGSLGLLRLPTYFERVHAPAIIATLGMWCIMHASIVYFSLLGHRLALHPLLIALFGFVSSMAMAKFLLRGEVIE